MSGGPSGNGAEAMVIDTWSDVPETDVAGAPAARVAPSSGVSGVVLLFAAQGANVVLTFLTYSLVSRRLGTLEAVSEFGLARSITLAFAYASDSMIRLVLVSRIAADATNARRLFGTAQTLQFLLALSAMPLLGAVISLGGWSDNRSAIWIAGLAAVTQYGSDLAAASLLARKRVAAAAALLVLDRALMAVCVTVAMAARPTVDSAFLGMLVANLLRALGSVAVARRIALFPLELGWSTRLAFDLLRRGAPVAVSLIAFAVSGRVALFVMDKRGGDATEQALLTAAITLLGLLNFIPTTFGLSELPSFGGAPGDRGRRQALHVRCFQRVLLASLATATGLSLAATPALSLLFGSRFAPAADTLRVALLSVPFGFLGHVYRYLLIPLRAQKQELAATCVGLTLQAALAWTWIPTHHALGGAAALLTAEVVVYLGKFWLTRRRLGGVGWAAGVFWPLLWLAGSAGLLFALPASWFAVGAVGQLTWTAGVALAVHWSARDALDVPWRQVNASNLDSEATRLAPHPRSPAAESSLSVSR